MKKLVKRISSLVICMALIFSFSAVAFAEVCESNPTIRSTTYKCEGNTCFTTIGPSPYNREYKVGYYQCWDSYAKPFEKHYEGWKNMGCC